MSNNETIVIAGRRATPVGAFNGGLSSVPAHYLGETVIREVLGAPKSSRPRSPR